jgi:hypothetical protein
VPRVCDLAHQLKVEDIVLLVGKRKEGCEERVVKREDVNARVGRRGVGRQG